MLALLPRLGLGLTGGERLAPGRYVGRKTMLGLLGGHGLALAQILIPGEP